MEEKLLVKTPDTISPSKVKVISLEELFKKKKFLKLKANKQEFVNNEKESTKANLNALWSVILVGLMVLSEKAEADIDNPLGDFQSLDYEGLSVNKDLLKQIMLNPSQALSEFVNTLSPSDKDKAKSVLSDLLVSLDS